MLKVHSFTPSTYFGSNMYVLQSKNEIAVIDPSVSFDEVTKTISTDLSRVKYVLMTHAHFDHMLFINEWAERAENVIIGEGDASSLSNGYLNCYVGFLGTEDGYYGNYEPVVDGQALPFGDTEIKVIGCPGHTVGSVSYRIDDCLFVGDTVFANGGYGRCDLPGGNDDALEASLIKIFTHQPDCIFYPGHGQSQWLHDAIKYFM